MEPIHPSKRTKHMAIKFIWNKNLGFREFRGVTRNIAKCVVRIRSALRTSHYALQAPPMPSQRAKNLSAFASLRAASSLLLITLLIFFLFVPSFAAAQEENGVSMQARIGFDGFFKSEYWVPVYLNVANSGPSVEGELRVTVGSGTFGDKLVTSSPISLPTQSNKRVVLYVNMARIGTPVVELVASNGEVVAETAVNPLQQLQLDGLLYGIVSSEPGEFEMLDRVTAGRPNVGVAFLGIEDLPETAVAWNALDVLVFNDVDTGTLSSTQREALAAWVNTGGQLVVTGGPGWQKTTAALADLLPVSVTGSESVADLPALSEAVAEPFRDPGPYLVTTSSLRGGELLYYQDNLPLLAAQKMGRGTVYFMALDPKLAPLLDWDGSEIVWGAIAARVPDLPPWGGPFQNMYAAGTAVTSLPSLALPSAWQLILFLLIYTILIGPVNYMILKRRNQLEKAWVTIPIFIVIFSGVAYVTGFQLRGNDVLINQMSVAYSQAGSEQARVQSLIGLYSPNRSTYDLVLPSSAVIRPFEENYGTLSGGGNVGAISLSNEVTVQDVRVDISGVETFMVQSVEPAPAITGQATLENNGSDLLLTAIIQNNSDQLLETASLLLGDTAVPVGDIPPGNIVNVSEIVGSFSGKSTFAPGAGVPVFATSGYVLSANAETLLGSSTYYDDAKLFTRFQLLQALEGNYGPSGMIGSLPAAAVTLVGWRDGGQVKAGLAGDAFETTGSTLYFIEMPLTQNLVAGGKVTLPVSLMNWDVLGQNNVYSTGIQELSLNGGWIEFAYTPWSDFQRMDVTDLAVVLEADYTGESAPEVRLWHWQNAIWDTIDDVGWGETAVTDFAPYIGPNNEVRLRLQDKTEYGVYINLVYPRLTGDLK